MHFVNELSKLAKEAGHAAQFNLGAMYYKGQCVARDMPQGYAWMALATQRWGCNLEKLSRSIGFS